jgi:tetratricopeptide (TPR) repeat protein
MEYLGSALPVDVFTEPEALTFLAARTGQADAIGAQAVAEELGRLPLALAQAAAVIANQHLSYATYLDRLRRLPVADLLPPEEAGQYPQGVAAAVLLSLDNVRAGDETEACVAVMNLLAVLSAAGVRRSIIHAAAREGPLPTLAPEIVDRALARLAGASLLTFSVVDGSTVIAHRLVTRVIRENLAASNSLTKVCQAVARLLAGQVRSRWENRHEDRAATRDLVEQIMALDESSARCPADNDLGRRMLRLRQWALAFLNELADSAAQAIVIGERLLTDQERTLGVDDPNALNSRNNLANAYWAAGRTDKAVVLHEQVLAVRERVLGSDHPDTLQSRHNLATAFQDAGRTNEAVVLHEQVLSALERVLSSDHPDTLTSRYNLALDYRDAGRTDEAIVLHEQVLAVRERVLGSDHPDTLISRRNLATAYQAAGRTDEAADLESPSS